MLIRNIKKLELMVVMAEVVMVAVFMAVRIVVMVSVIFVIGVDGV